jgi:hypothetical protein
MDVTGTTAPTLTNVEKVTVGFTTGGAFNAGNGASLSTIKIEEAATGTAAAAVVINVGDGDTVSITDTNGGSDLSTVTVDSVAGGDLTTNIKLALGSALTITDAVGLTYNATGTAVTAATSGLVLDNIDTTSLTVVGANTAFSLSSGNVTLSDALTTLSLSTSTTTGTVQIGSVADADSLTSLTATAANANITIGVIGTDSTNAGNAEVLSTVSFTATGSSTIDIDDIFADDNVNSATDNAMTLTLTTETGSTITTGDIDNVFGAVTVTASGDGAHNFGNVTEQVLGTVLTADFSGATGSNNINTVAVTGSSNVTLAVGDGADVIQIGSNGSTVINNFQAGTGLDQIELDISDIGVIIGGDGADDGAAVTTLIVEATGADTVAAGENIVVLSGANFATAALAEAAIENGGGYELTLAGANTANDDLIIVWSDGSNSYIGAYNITSTATNPLVGALTTIAELTGIVASTAGTLDSNNFDLIA